MEFYEEKINDSKNYADRYRNCKILLDRETDEVLLSTRENLEVPESTDDSYHRVELHEIGRLDLISYKYYNNPNLWWVIAQANNIVDPFLPIESGTLLRIPSINSLYGNKGILL